MCETLKDAIDLFEGTDHFTWHVRHMSDDWKEVKFYDDAGLRSNDVEGLFVCGFEFGPSMLIHARSFEAAWEIWVNESPTIPESELPEAYGIEDDYRARFEEDDPCPRWGDPTWDAWHVRFHAACVARLRELGDKAHDGIGEYPELIEGYEYQSNSSGTGIVSMGHYAWMNEIEPKDIRAERKSTET